MLLDVNDKNFENEVLKSDLPVLVDFWAPWCMPCRMVAPIVEELAEKMAGKIKVCKVNTEENMTLAVKQGIMTIPTFKLFKKGEVIAETVGKMSLSELKAFVEQAL